MPTLGNPAATWEVVQRHQFSIQKKYGQNFLIDHNILEKIVQESGIGSDDLVLEVGPGIGTMTQYLAESAREVVAVEIDKALIPILQETLFSYHNVEIRNEDILKVDVAKIVQDKNEGRPIHVVANLPYYITTPIIMGLFESRVPIKSITVMVQKEVAERMQVGPGTKDYGALSLAVAYYAKAKIVMQVSANCFLPKPNVGSAVIHMEVYDTPPIKAKDDRHMFRIIRASFEQRRKTLVNSLGNSPILSYSKEEIVRALEQMGIRIDIRGEALTLSQFAQLSDLLTQ